MTKMNMQVVRQHAADFCRYARNNDKRMVNSMVEFYKESPKAPSVANAIFRDETKKSIHYLAQEMDENILSSDFTTIIKTYLKKVKDQLYNTAAIDAQLDIIPYVGKHIESFETKYPKTGLLRMELIKNDRINASTNKISREINGQHVEIGEVTPKASWIEKIKYAKFFK